MKRWLRELGNAGFIAIGILSAAMGLKGFLLSSNFIDGGVTGICMLLAKTTGVSLSVLLPLINLPFVAVGYRHMGGRFAVRSVLGISGLALTLAIVPFPDVTPDLVLTMATPFPVPATGDVPWVTVPSNDYVFPKDTWIQAIEVRPGNRRVVHHAVAAATFPGDNPDGGGSNVHLYSPGLEAITWRDGYGKLMPKGTRISFQMHYNSIGKEQTDQTKVGFKFATKPVHTPVNTTIVSNTAIVTPPLVQNHEAIAAFQFPVEARVHGLRPHMHLRAREGTASLVYPDGLRRVLLHIPRWDDAWQNYYILKEPARVPKGTLLEYIASYDNSPANALNPDPKVSVKWGQQIWEEMHSTYMTWTAVTDKNVNDTEPIQIPANKAFTTGVSARR